MNAPVGRRGGPAAVKISEDEIMSVFFVLLSFFQKKVRNVSSPHPNLLPGGEKGPQIHPKVFCSILRYI